jgi:hypothetical protein
MGCMNQNDKDHRCAIVALRMYDRKQALPDWIAEESVGYSYEKEGIGSDEIIGFLEGFLAGIQYERNRQSEVDACVSKSFGDWISKEAPTLTYDQRTMAWCNLAYKAAHKRGLKDSNIGRIDPVIIKEEFDKIEKKLSIAKEALARIKWMRPVLPERVLSIATEALQGMKDAGEMK